MKIKCVDSIRVNVNIFASTSVPFILTTVQVPNLALTHKKWITVQPPFNPFVPITVEHLSYMTQVIEIWPRQELRLHYPVKASGDFTMCNCFKGSG